MRSVADHEVSRPHFGRLSHRATRRRPTADQAAQFVAESIETHGLDVHDPDTWERYGLSGNHAAQADICALLHTTGRCR